jgi:hypothetical protein
MKATFHFETKVTLLSSQALNARSKESVEPDAEVVICCEADEQWSYVRPKGKPRWLFYAYDHIRKRVLAHIFGPRNALTLRLY